MLLDFDFYKAEVFFLPILAIKRCQINVVFIYDLNWSNFSNDVIKSICCFMVISALGPCIKIKWQTDLISRFKQFVAVIMTEMLIWHFEITGTSKKAFNTSALI